MVITRKHQGLLLAAISILLILILTFVKADIDDRNTFFCEVIDNSPDLDMSQCPAHNGSTSWLITAAFGVSFLILGSSMYMVFAPKAQQDPQTRKKVDISKLDKDELRIYELLKENDGSMYQSDLIKETDFSKVKMTRLLDKLVNRGLVDRQRRGMTNIVVLK